MPTTITAYYTFTAGNRARASQFNTNLSNHRGTLLPINTDTASASDNAHDLGASDHRWKDGYLGGNLFMGSTIEVTGNFLANQFIHFGKVTGTAWSFKYDTAGSQLDFQHNSSTICSFKTTGFEGAGLVNSSVSESKLASSVAGDGLAGGAGSPLSVNVDNSTIAITGDIVAVKTLGISSAYLAANAVTEAKLSNYNVTSQKIRENYISYSGWTSTGAPQTLSVDSGTLGDFPGFISSSHTVNMTCSGFSGGLVGQRIWIRPISAYITFVNAGGGTQPIYTRSGSSVTVNANSGIMFICDGSKWIEI